MLSKWQSMLGEEHRRPDELHNSCMGRHFLEHFQWQSLKQTGDLGTEESTRILSAPVSRNAWYSAAPAYLHLQQFLDNWNFTTSNPAPWPQAQYTQEDEKSPAGCTLLFYGWKLGRFPVWGRCVNRVAGVTNSIHKFQENYYPALDKILNKGKFVKLHFALCRASIHV